MMYESINELYHHGIKGQKWGIRRFQNMDGSLTKAGMSRYGNGKAVVREHTKILLEKEEQLKKQSKAYQNALKEYSRLSDQYDLDKGPDENDSPLLAKEREWAAQKRWSVGDDIDNMDDSFYKKAWEYADKQILKKYGDVGVANMHHYESVNQGIAFLTLGAGAVIMLALVGKK